jgi:hypothetical protein
VSNINGNHTVCNSVTLLRRARYCTPAQCKPCGPHQLQGAKGSRYKARQRPAHAVAFAVCRNLALCW